VDAGQETEPEEVPAFTAAEAEQASNADSSTEVNKEESDARIKQIQVTKLIKIRARILMT
jgi:hypothetical protein